MEAPLALGRPAVWCIGGMTLGLSSCLLPSKRWSLGQLATTKKQTFKRLQTTICRIQELYVVVYVFDTGSINTWDMFVLSMTRTVGFGPKFASTSFTTPHWISTVYTAI